MCGPSLGRKRPRRAAIQRRHRHIALQQYAIALHKKQGPRALILSRAGLLLCGLRQLFDVSLHFSAGAVQPSRRNGEYPVSSAVFTATFSTDIAAFADRLAAASARITLPLFRTGLAADDKSADGVFDPVTAADRDAETAMRELIREAFPDHGIEGEEHDDERLDADFVWVLDPIDGTRAFIAGLPLWGTLIGLKYRGRPVFGLLHQPFTGETFSGSTFSDETRAALYRRGDTRHDLRTRARADIGEATLATTSPRLFKGADLDAYDRVERHVRLARYGYDCYAYAMLTAGHLDLVVEAGLKPCDILPLVPIIEAAGGVVTTWEGAPVTGGGTVVAAGDARLHAAALALLGA